jgi:hypothetical protein
MTRTSTVRRPILVKRIGVGERLSEQRDQLAMLAGLLRAQSFLERVLEAALRRLALAVALSEMSLLRRSSGETCA